MDTLFDRTWTTDSFLAWEDRQEGKFEFDGRDPVAMTGGSAAHQDIVGNLWVSLRALLAGTDFRPLMEMRLTAGGRVRYPDVAVSAGPVEDRTRTLTDALAIFEVLSDDTATTDRIDKLIDYALLPSLRAYVLLEQTSIGATLFSRVEGGPWTASAQTDGALALPGLDIVLSLAAVYQGLSLTARRTGPS